MAISTNPKPAIYRSLYENTGPGDLQNNGRSTANGFHGFCPSFDTVDH